MADVERRQTIRRTWGSLLAPVFVLGSSAAPDPALDDALRIEAETYADILQVLYL